jgi:hypothetical protein
MHESHARGCASELIVAYRFVEAGRAVSWPLVPRAYDLLVDGGDRVYRVQVKTGHRAEGKGLRVTIKHVNGREAIRENFDYLCIVDTANQIYVIPSVACECRFRPEELLASIEIRNGRYDMYLNRFEVGSGPVAGTPGVVEDGRGMRRLTGRVWPRGGQRKRHRRVDLASALEIYRLRETGNVRELAAQFQVTAPTILNLFAGRRKDVRAALERVPAAPRAEADGTHQRPDHRPRNEFDTA